MEYELNASTFAADLWRRLSTEGGRPQVEPPDIDAFLAEHQPPVRARATEHLEPWVTLSGQGLLWLSHLHLSLEDAVEKSNRHRATWALVGFASIQCLAIRNLALAGLDSPARGLIRIFIEALTYCVICLDDEKLADQFVQADGAEAARRLWKKEMSGARLRERFSAAVGTRDAQTIEALQAFAFWLNDENEMSSQVVHASYVACALSVLPQDVESKEHVPGLFGAATAFSHRTLATIARATWFFSRMIAPHLLGIRPPGARLHSFKRDSYPDSVVVSGYYVLEGLMARYWEADLLRDD